MAYLGHKPAVGENNSFRILDDISSFVLTFDGSSASVVGLSDETITITENNHRFITGQRVTYSNGGGGNITGLVNGQAYFVINHSKTQIKLASSASNALAGTAVNLTGLGTGSSHTLTLAFDGVNTKFDPTFGNGMHDTLIKRAAQLVISINGVIQQPHDTATPTTGFGVDSLGHIIFSTAPASTDIFWGHILASNTVTFDSSDNDVDTFTGNGSTTSFTLSKIPPDNRNILVTIDGVVQYPSDAANTRSYNVSENVMTFTAAPGLGTVIQVRHIGYAGVSGGGGGGVTGFYGRTGNVSLVSTDNIVANNATFNGNVSIAQTLTYEDVTDIDSVGLITARSGIKDQTLTAGHVVFAGTGGRLSGEADLFYNSSNDRLGIGTNVPSEKLDVLGNASISGRLTSHSARFEDDGTSDNPIVSVLADDHNPYAFQVGNSTYTTSLLTGHLLFVMNDGDVYHDFGSNTSAYTDVFFRLRNSSGTFKNCISFEKSDQSVELYAEGNKKLETNSSGINITGITTVSTRLNINIVSSTELAVAGTNTPWRGMFMIKDTTTGSGAQPYMTFWDGSEANDGSNTGLLGRAGHVNGGNTNERFDFWTYRSTTPLSLGTNGYERLRILPAGQTLITSNVNGNTISARTVLSNYTPTFQIEGNSKSTTSASLTANVNNTVGPSLWFAKTRGTSLGSNTAAQSGDELGTIVFNGADGTDIQTMGSYIRGVVDGSVSSNNVPGRLQFHTATGGTMYERLRISSNGDIVLGTASAAGGKLYFESTSGAAQYIASGGTNNQDLIFGSSSGTKLTIDEDGSVLIIGNSSFTPVDTRNVGGIHIRDNRGISFKAYSGSTASRNWRIRNDDLSNFGDLNISCGNNNTSDISDSASELVMTFTKERNVIIGDPTYGTGLGQLRINNDASSTPASLSLHGYGNTNTGDVFAKIDFASQENSTTGQVTAGIEAQAVGTAERAADLVFKTRPDTSGSSAIERVRMTSDGTTTISGVPAYGAISKTASSNTYYDVFVYDTRKDSDGGAWRHRTTNTSWYNETLDTSIRGARREFPQVAIVAVGGNTIHIFDADDPDMPMWMEFPSPSGGARNVMYGSGNPRCVYMLNGILCTGSQATNYWPILIDFIRDDIIGLRDSGGHLHYNGTQGNISLRNAATSDSGKWWPGTLTNGPSGGARVTKRWWFDGSIVNNHVTAVVMSVRPEAPIDKTTGMQIPTIYLGTRGGVSIIHSNSGDTGTSYNSGIYDITSNNGPYSGVGAITITDDGYLWTLHDRYDPAGGSNYYNYFRDSSAIDLKRLDNQMNDMTHSPSADALYSLNNQGGGSPNKGREYYWPSTGAEAGTHKIGQVNTWAADIIERDAWGCVEGLAFVKRSIYTYDHKESANFLPLSHQNRGLVAMITKDYNTGWHMTGNEISSAYIADGLTSSISGSGAMIDRGHKARHLTVSGTLTRSKCATGSDLSAVSGFNASNYARIISSNINAGNPLNITMMGWIKITDISGYSYICSIANGAGAGMGIAVNQTNASLGGKPYFYDSTHGSMQGDISIHDGEWHHVCGVFSCNSNRKLLYVDGQRQSTVFAPANVDYSDLDTIAVGHWCGSGTGVSHSCLGHLALVKLGLTDLTDQQIKRIYEDEKKLLLPNAKAFLYGSSNEVKAIGYDEKKEIYHVGTSSGRSDFSGLSRINNTTTAVTTAISAYDGLIAEQ